MIIDDVESIDVVNVIWETVGVCISTGNVDEEFDMLLNELENEFGRQLANRIESIVSEYVSASRRASFAHGWRLAMRA